LTGDRKSAAWLTEALQEQVTPTDSADGDIAETIFADDTRASMALNCWGAARNRLQPLELVYREAKRCDDRMPGYGDIAELVERYEQAQRLDDKLDFTDLLGRFVGVKFSVEGPTGSLYG